MAIRHYRASLGDFCLLSLTSQTRMTHVAYHLSPAGVVNRSGTGWRTRGFGVFPVSVGRAVGILVKFEGRLTNGNGRRANGSRPRPNSPSSSAKGSSANDEKRPRARNS